MKKTLLEKNIDELSSNSVDNLNKEYLKNKIAQLTEITNRIDHISSYNYDYHICLFQELLESQNADKVFSELKLIPVDKLGNIRGVKIETLKHFGINNFYNLKEHEYELVDVVGISDSAADKISNVLLREEKKILSTIRSEIKCSLDTLGRDVLIKTNIYEDLNILQSNFSKDFASSKATLEMIISNLSYYEKKKRIELVQIIPLIEKADSIITGSFLKRLEKYEEQVNEILKKAINDIWDYYLNNEKSYNGQYKALI